VFLKPESGRCPRDAVMLSLFQHPWCRAREGEVAKQPCVYLLASQRLGTLYIGVTSNLVARLWQHRSGTTAGFTSRYGVFLLVRFEFFADMPSAIAREKQLKRWHRQWKINLIESDNPDWVDLAPALGLEPLVARVRRDGC
jgi:putative endonuclease